MHFRAKRVMGGNVELGSRCTLSIGVGSLKMLDVQIACRVSDAALLLPYLFHTF